MNSTYRQDIAEQLRAMYLLDQAMRERAESVPDYWDDSVDRENVKLLKKIVAEIGWPTIPKVGLGSMEAALIARHADKDVEFQAHCLQLMKDEARNSPGSVSLQDIAYLEDRVRVNQKRPQLYGTQFDEKDGMPIPRPIENPGRDNELLNERRARMALPTMADGIRAMHLKYVAR